jgi:hypothetical protein
MVVAFFLVCIGKKGPKLDFWMFNGWKQNFPELCRQFRIRFSGLIFRIKLNLHI